ncbi:selenocysteine-specific translation elongation factor [Gordonia sinesedis]
MADRNYVVATAGHVDHGKSALIRVLTGIEPDRWAEERRRGLTIDLGFAWTTLPSGADVAFVDVPGHERFLGNMLAGLGPTPVVLFVVAADEGWSAQSDDHRDAIAALGVEHGVLVLTKADRAPADRIVAVLAEAREHLADTGLADVPVVVTSAVTGVGFDDLRRTLDDVLAAQPTPLDDGRVRLWVDRAFSITGAGTVVTGTLAAGSLAVGDRLDIIDGRSPRSVIVRGLQSEGADVTAARPVRRIAVNLRGVAAADIARGDALVTPDSWPQTAVIDLRRVTGDSFDAAPQHITAHVGTAALPARLRPFDAEHARLTLDRAVPLTPGDRIVLRDPGHRVVGGGQVLDVDPPPLGRRGDAARRGDRLSTMDADGDLLAEIARRGAVDDTRLRRLGLIGGRSPEPPDGVRVTGRWWIDEQAVAAWAARLRSAVADLHRRDPLAAGLSRGAVVDLLALPDESLVDVVVAEAGLASTSGYVAEPDSSPGLGDAEDAVAALEHRLGDRPFAAPEADDLAALGLGTRHLAAAERGGRLIRLSGGVVLLPTAPALAMRTLAGLDQPFTTSDARQALKTTRRVVIPLLEHLDGRGWTRRLDAGHREVVRASRR